eukprot:jgi/Botrbrau1/4334/Bobra.0232s0023.1
MQTLEALNLRLIQCIRIRSSRTASGNRSTRWPGHSFRALSLQRHLYLVKLGKMSLSGVPERMVKLLLTWPITPAFLAKTWPSPSLKLGGGWGREPVWTASVCKE